MSRPNGVARICYNSECVAGEEVCMKVKEIERRLARLANEGLTVSICCGESSCLYSVLVMNREGETFDNPFGATGVEHAVDIAEIECKKRGWI